ncbi:nuclear transport factor 2 family protein [Aminobacter sp. MET-1]|uniref:nuclear transport factor 2 family protein n=1 Tax=Aminobacter sp. MET-1 TaxID=2951085 RepID=UPI002269C092|nr:nuclear transport factor 2 family protein [Aminobacter sp. MET-1]MCX8568894.1 nuclear transport factor 2 family protein [Aminobacter sp. MET-1]
MSLKVYRPADMNETFAAIRNSGAVEALLALYEDDARLLVDPGGAGFAGKAAIAEELERLVRMPGTMRSQNTFCVEHGDLALLRADFAIVDEEGTTLYSGFTAEIVRRQADGTWLYVVDHAGASRYGAGA